MSSTDSARSARIRESLRVAEAEIGTPGRICGQNLGLWTRSCGFVRPVSPRVAVPQPPAYTCTGGPCPRTDFTRPPGSPLRGQGRRPPRSPPIQGSFRPTTGRCAPTEERAARHADRKEIPRGRRHHATAPGERRSLRAPDTALEPEDEALHLHGA